MTPMHRRGFLAFGSLAAGTLAAPSVLRAQGGLRTLADTMAGDNRFARFLDLITRATMVDTFRQASPMTVFAPVDQAFLGAPAGIMQDLIGNMQSGNNVNEVERQRVAALINYHIVPGALRAEEFTGADRRVRTVNGGDLVIRGSGSNVTVINPAPAQQMGSFGAAGAQMSASPAQVIGGATLASNGVLYPVSQILWP